MEKNWQAAMTYLERKFPQRWGRRVDVTTGGLPVMTVRVIKLDPETGEEMRPRFELPTLGSAPS
jgi:hypothetical protein